MFLTNTLSKINKFNPWTPVLGLSRSLLALCTLSTIAVNDINLIIQKAEISKSNLLIDRINIFSLFSEHLIAAQIISIVILLFVISGFYPFLTAILHWWVALSYKNSSMFINGGDTIAGVITLLLIPICLFDKRRNHWQKSIDQHTPLASIWCYVAFITLHLQISFIYFDACISKLVIPEWKSGTAIWYYSYYSVFQYIKIPFMLEILSNSIICFTLTYSVLILEFLLAISIFQKGVAKYKLILFIIGILFHLIISIEIGILNFAFTMFGVLILLLIPFDFDIYNIKKSYARL